MFEDRHSYIIEPKEDISTCAGLVEYLFPSETKDHKKIPLAKRIWFFLFPGFTWKSFTFWFSLAWAGWNAFVFVMYQSNINYMEHAYECVLEHYYCGYVIFPEIFSRNFISDDKI
jgi:hypothetical protein